jgi:hypothetical protein
MCSPGNKEFGRQSNNKVSSDQIRIEVQFVRQSY